METCPGCGEQLGPNWKYCIHCGIAIEAAQAPGATGSVAVVRSKPTPIPRALLFGGIGIFLVGIALLVIAIAFFAGASH
jgi:uncharacterized membrane protein YvbJ